MIISLIKEYKSLSKFVSEELPDFTIITGKNGSGKSQLLKIIEIGLNEYISIDLPIIHVQSGGLVNSNTTVINNNSWLQPVRQIVDEYNRLFAKDIFNYVIESGINPYSMDRSWVEANFELKDKLKEAFVNQGVSARLTRGSGQSVTANDMLNHFFSQERERMFEMSLKICRSKSKTFLELKESDYYNFHVSDAIVDTNELFGSKIEMVFYNYVRNRNRNHFNYFKKKEGSENNDSVSFEEYLKMNRPPWDVINEIFDRHKIKFHFKPFEEGDFHPDANYKLKIVSNLTDHQLDFEELSSGEQVIIGLILKMFTTEHYRKDLKFPDLILLDEPDAHLHPEMSQLLLEVLQQTFVEVFKIKVIISTHSATTVALSPSDNIFKLSNGPFTSLEKIPKDDALGLLTSFIPTLSIDYKNHRQIFVESPTDVDYFQNIYSRYQSDADKKDLLNHKLYFISTGYGKSNCVQVYNIIESLRNAGSLTSFGIVDWDNKPPQKVTDYVKIHGHGERYSVENFILDPIYVYLLLVQENNANGSLSKLGLNATDNQFLVGEKNETEINAIFANYFKEIESKFSHFKYANLQTVEYLNGKKVLIPHWYLNTKGHQIVDKLKEIYPVLGKKYQNEGDLQKQLSIIAAKCYPFVPLKTIELLDELAINSLKILD